jgi:hypothetical protein
MFPLYRIAVPMSAEYSPSEDLLMMPEIEGAKFSIFRYEDICIFFNSRSLTDGITASHFIDFFYKKELDNSFTLTGALILEYPNKGF